MKQSNVLHTLPLLSSCKLETVKLTYINCFEVDVDVRYLRASHHHFDFQCHISLTCRRMLLVFWNSIWSYFSKRMVFENWAVSVCFISYWKLSRLTDLYYFFSYKSFLSNWNCVRDYINCTSSCCCFFSPTVNLSDKCTKSVPCQRYVTNYKVLRWKYHFTFMYLFFFLWTYTKDYTISAWI